LFDEKINVGIDRQQKELDKAKEYDAYDELLCCFGDKIPKEGKSFNTIFSNSVMEHIPDIESVLKEMHRLLTDTGDIYLTVPTDKFDKYSVTNSLLESVGLKSLAKRYREFFNGCWRHYHFYTLKQWNEMFERNGFILKESIDYSRKSTTRLNLFLAPFSAIPYLSKKFLNRWFLSSATRYPFAKLNLALFKNALQTDLENLNTHKGAIIFFHLKKKN
jgi:SAM-dependent methyltransferase